MIKIVQIMESTIGGTRKHLKDLLYNLDRNIFKVTVICSTLRDPTFLKDIASLEQNGIEVFILQMKRKISPLSDLWAFKKLYNLLTKGNYHIVHAHSSKAGFLGRLAAKLAGVPVVLYTPHSFSFQSPNSLPVKRFYILLERFAAQYTDKIITVSYSVKKAALETQICPPSMVQVIENGINPKDFQIEVNTRKLREEFGIAKDERVIGTVARYCPQKGYNLLLEAARNVIKMDREVKFLLIGDGELRGEIESMIQKLNISQNVIITGERKDLPELYAIMDVFVLPSLWEGLPYSILEAMAAGKPVVATSVSGIKDIVVQNKTGILVPPDDTKALTLAIVQLLKNKKYAEKLGREGKKIIKEKYKLKNQIRKLESLYINMIEEKVKDVKIKRITSGKRYVS